MESGSDWPATVAIVFLIMAIMILTNIRKTTILQVLRMCIRVFSCYPKTTAIETVVKCVVKNIIDFSPIGFSVMRNSCQAADKRTKIFINRYGGYRLP